MNLKTKFVSCWLTDLGPQINSFCNIFTTFIHLSVQILIFPASKISFLVYSILHAAIIAHLKSVKKLPVQFRILWRFPILNALNILKFKLYKKCIYILTLEFSFKIEIYVFKLKHVFNMLYLSMYLSDINIQLQHKKSTNTLLILL